MPSSSPPAAFNPVPLAIGLLFSLACGLVPLYVVPQFAQTFAGFGAPLPGLTRIFVDYPWILCALPLLTLAVWASAPARGRDVTAGLFGVFAGLLGLATMGAAMYLPIFSLAATL